MRAILLSAKERNFDRKISEPSRKGERQASLSCSRSLAKNQQPAYKYDCGMLPGLSAFFNGIKRAQVVAAHEDMLLILVP